MHRPEPVVKPRAATEKTALHPRNRHRGRYDFELLVQASPALGRYVRVNAYGDSSIDFANAQAVKALNRALLKQVYGIEAWDVPAQYLCPPIPGRADYLHYLADLLTEGCSGTIPRGACVRVLDIGVGANAIYPLIGHREYGWHFVGSDIDAKALENVQRVLDANPDLTGTITLRQQAASTAIFSNVLLPGERYDLTMCNPPFHAGPGEAAAGTRRKWNNLGKGAAAKLQPTLNFGGQGAELWCPGGEEAFISRMVAESATYAQQCLWFTTLVSKAASLPAVYRALKKAGAVAVRTVPMAQGQKQSRFVAWSFLAPSQQHSWRAQYWASPAVQG